LRNQSVLFFHRLTRILHVVSVPEAVRFVFPAAAEDRRVSFGGAQLSGQLLNIKKDYAMNMSK